MRVVDRVDAPLDAGADVRAAVVVDRERDEVRVVAAKELLGAAVGVEAGERALARLGPRRGDRVRSGACPAGAALGDVGQLAVLVGDRVERSLRAERDAFHVFAGEIVEHRRAPGPGDPVEHRLAARARVERAVGGERERHEVRLVAVEVDLRLARRRRCGRAFPRARWPRRARSAWRRRRAPRRGRRLRGRRTWSPCCRRVERCARWGSWPRRRALLKPVTSDVTASCAGVGEGRHLPARDAEDLAGVAGAEQHAAVALQEDAPDRARVAEPKASRARTPRARGRASRRWCP